MYWSNYTFTKDLINGDLLLINFLSGSVDVVTNSDVAKVKKFREICTTNLSDELVIKLTKRGYIYQSVEAEIKQIETLIRNWKLSSKKKPTTYFLCPTTQCNLSCIYCFQNHNRAKVMSKYTLMNSINEIKNFSSNNNFSYKEPLIIIFGGEPLLYSTKGLIKIINEEARKANLKLAIITNGTKLNEFLPLLNKSLIEYIQVTLDGPQRIHDMYRPTSSGRSSFIKIIDGLSKAIDNGFNIFCRTNISMDNIQYLPELAELYIEKGWANAPNFKAYLSPINHKDCGIKKDGQNQSELVKEILSMIKENSTMQIFHLHGWYIVESLLSLIRERRLLPPKIIPCEAKGNHITIFPSGKITNCPLQDEKTSSISISENYWINKILSTASNCIINKKCEKCKLRFICDHCDLAGDFYNAQEFCIEKENILNSVVDAFLPEILNMV